MRNAIRLIAPTIIAVPKPKHALAIFCVLLGASAWAQVVFTITDLGPNVYPEGINAKGQVSGSGFCSTCGPNQQAILWSASTGLIDLGGPSNNFGSGSAGFGLNDLGEVVGTSSPSFQCCDAFLWSSSGKTQDLGAPPGCVATGIGINDSGKVVGETSSNTGVFNPTCHLFVWDSKSGMQDIGFPPGAFVSGVSGINNAGTAVGAYVRASDFTPRSYTWTRLGGFRDLGIPQSESVGINAKNHAVGGYKITCFFCNSGRAFLWEPLQGVRDLGVLPGHTFSFARALNDYDQVVGFSSTEVPVSLADVSAFLWTKSTGMLNLNDLIESSSGWHLYFAESINAKGQIVGRGLLNGVEHGFLLTTKDAD